MTPSGMRGVLNDAIRFTSRMRHSRAFVAWWCIGSKAEAAGGVFQVREMSRRRELGRGCTGRRDGQGASGRAEWTDTAHRLLPILRIAFGVVVIGTEACHLSSCGGGTSPKAPGGSDDAPAERTSWSRGRPAWTTSGRSREGIRAGACFDRAKRYGTGVVSRETPR